MTASYGRGNSLLDPSPILHLLDGIIPPRFRRFRTSFSWLCSRSNARRSHSQTYRVAVISSLTLARSRIIVNRLAGSCRTLIVIIGLQIDRHRLIQLVNSLSSGGGLRNNGASLVSIPPVSASACCSRCGILLLLRLKSFSFRFFIRSCRATSLVR